MKDLYKIKKTITAKKKLHTIKVLLIVCLLTGLICDIGFGKGKLHDFQMFKSVNFDLSNELGISVDSGLQVDGEP